ncbi:cobalt/nickel transport system permease protein [Streptococcus rupicaprae]|uniref:Cobalt/nickel transport system permease protein n=1 Tax=Streptococcus rupicaprae TaxID=759619 RepID=A0ABV2FF11_9STRE
MLIFDYYAYRNRWVGVNPKIKVLLYVLSLGISFSGILSWQLGLLSVLVPLTLYVGRIHWRSYVKWVAVSVPFVFISLVTILFSISRTLPAETLWSWRLGSYVLSIEPAAYQETLALLVRVYVSLAATFFLTVTTPFPQLISLCRKAHVPKELIELVVLMYRFIFMFLHEFLVMRDTLDLKFGFGGVKQSYQTLGLLSSQLFTRLIQANQHVVEMLEIRFDQ